MSETNNIQIDTTKDLDSVMSMFNFIEHSDDYAKIKIYGNIAEMGQIMIM